MASNDKALPPGWEYRWDPAQKAYFYVNHSTRKTQWEDPRIAYYQELSKTEDGNDELPGYDTAVDILKGQQEKLLDGEAAGDTAGDTAGAAPLAAGEDSDDTQEGEEDSGRRRSEWARQTPADVGGSADSDGMEMNSLLAAGDNDNVDTSSDWDASSHASIRIEVNDGSGPDLSGFVESQRSRRNSTDVEGIPLEFIGGEGLPASRPDGDSGSVRRYSVNVEDPDADKYWRCPIRLPVVSELCENVVGGVSGLSDSKKLLVLLLAVVFVGIVLLVTLLPASFVYIEYYEYGMSRSKWTGAVDYDEVYEFGCHLLRPQDEIIRLPSTAHHVVKDLSVNTRENLNIHVSISMQYFLKREEVPELYQKYYLDYNAVMESLIESTVKNLAVTVWLDDFRLDRKTVEAKIRQRLEYVFQGNCSHSSQTNCYKGHHVDLRFFQLGRVWIPDSVMERYMTTLVLKEKVAREFYVQEKAIEVKSTEQKVKDMLNKAREVREAANAGKLLISARAEAEADKEVQMAYQTAVRGLFSQLNVTDEDNKLSFMYVRALKDMKQPLYTFNYEANKLYSP